MENKCLDNCTAIDTGLDGISFFRCTIKAGEAVTPKPDAEELIVFLFNGNSAFVQTRKDIFNITEPSVFVPDFDRSPYTIQAIEDLEFMMCVFTMNEWDKAFFKGWNLHLPFFSKYSDGVRFNYMGRSKRLGSWSLIQPFQLGHLSLSVICGRGGKTESQGNPLQNQWLYAVGDSRYQLSVNNEEASDEIAGSFRFIPVNQPYTLTAEENVPVCYFNIEYFVEADIQKNYLAQIFNGRMTETR